jgi:predicted transcriptional regulator
MSKECMNILESKENSIHGTYRHSTTKNGAKVQKTMDLLSLLSKPPALKIFTLAKDGIKSHIDTHSEIGLTRKQYYLRLNQLVKIGLLIKYDDTYMHTVLGKIIYHDYLLRLEKDVSNSKHMEMMDILDQSSRFSKDEIEEVFSKIR